MSLELKIIELLHTLREFKRPRGGGPNKPITDPKIFPEKTFSGKE
jgi:hypothetical protein